MATKTISIDIEAYERLRTAREHERESFSKVIKRAVWPARAGTAAALLAWRNNADANQSLSLPETSLDALDELQEQDTPADNKWEE